MSKYWIWHFKYTQEKIWTFPAVSKKRAFDSEILVKSTRLSIFLKSILLFQIKMISQVEFVQNFLEFQDFKKVHKGHEIY